MAMENGPVEDVFPIEKWGFSIAMLVYWREIFQTFIIVFHVTLPEKNIFAPESQMVGRFDFLLGPGLFSGAKLLLVSGSVP